MAAIVSETVMTLAFQLYGNRSGCQIRLRRCSAAFRLRFFRARYRLRISSLSAVINFLFSSIVPTEMRTHSGKP